MSREKLTITGGLCLLLAVLIAACGCAKEKADQTQSCPVGETSCEKDEHGKGHAHATGSEATTSASIEERVSAKCECGIPIYQCDECRYEVGLVKIDTGLMKQDNGDGLVRTHSVAKTRIVDALPATGEVALNENAAVHIGPRIAGIIESVPVDIGAQVKAQDTLLTMMSVELGRALADYERNKTMSGLSEKIFLRESKLMEQKVGSEQDMLEAQMTYEQYRTDLKASEQNLRILGLTDADLAEMREPGQGTGVGRLSIRAPIAGTIIEKHAVSGEMVEPGTDLMLLSDLSTVWVWANVQSRDLARLLAAEKRGAVAVEITVEAFPERKFEGVLDYVGATMNEQTRTVKVRATIKNPTLELRPGMFCEAAFSLDNGNTEEVLAVPSVAVLSDEGILFVFKHWKDDFFLRHDIRKGREFSGMIEVLEGLQPGDIVVAEGAFLLKSDVLREKMGAGCAD